MSRTDAELVANELIGAYKRAWEEIVVEQEAIATDPRRASRRKRLKALEASVQQSMAALDTSARGWLQTRFPTVYALGATDAAEKLTGDFAWTDEHTNAITEAAKATYDDLLAATTYVRQSTKTFIRAMTQQQVEAKLILGLTAGQGAQRLRKVLQDKGITSVIYSNGARHGLASYTEMVLRTRTALAYNQGTLNQSTSEGVRYFEVFDGPDCQLITHNSGGKAAGTIRSAQECASHPISHPSCRRSFGPRPDIKSRNQAQEAKSSVTPEQVQAQREQDELRIAAQKRQAAIRAQHEAMAARKLARRIQQNFARQKTA